MSDRDLETSVVCAREQAMAIDGDTDDSALPSIASVVAGARVVGMGESQQHDQFRTRSPGRRGLAQDHRASKTLGHLGSSDRKVTDCGLTDQFSASCQEGARVLFTNLPSFRFAQIVIGLMTT